MEKPIIDKGVKAIAEIFSVGKFGQDPQVAQRQLNLIRMAVVKVYDGGHADGYADRIYDVHGEGITTDTDTHVRDWGLLNKC